ncbi:MAG: MMPL family transporter, partial [Planctomycetales bacterium]|nr:MMPL family transporter [Planctomycetales bacterium]
MKTYLTAEPVAKLLLAIRWPLLGLAVLASLWAVRPARQLVFDRSIERMFADNDPRLESWLRLKRTFGGNEIVLAAYVDENVLTRQGYDRLTSVAKQLREVDGVAAVLSLESPIGPLILADDSELARRYRELFAGYTHARDGTVAAFSCMLQAETGSGASHAATIEALRAIIEQHPQGTLAGEPTLLADGFGALEVDGARLGWTSTVLLAVTIIACFRSWRWTIAPLLVVQLALQLTRACLATAGMHLSMVSSMLTAIVTVIGVATVMHVIVRFRDARSRGLAPRDALIETLAILIVPVSLACMTDAVGFLSLLVAEVEPVRDFGVMMASGAMMVGLASALLLPGVSLIGERGSAAPRQADTSVLAMRLRAVLHWTLRHRRRILIAAAVIGCAAAAGGSRLEVETDFTHNFRSDSRVVTSYEFVEQRLGGAGVWDIVLPAPAELNWPYVERVLELEKQLRDETPGLTKVLSLADALEAAMVVRPEQVSLEAVLNLQLRAEAKAMELKMPEFYAALYSPDPKTPEQHYLRIMLRAAERQTADQKQTMIAGVARITEEHFPRAEVTGYFVLMTWLIDSVVRDQWIAFAFATMGIGLMLLQAFRSPWLAVAALVPNALPVVMVVGVLGWFADFGLKLNMGAAMIAAVSMGLSVDASIHYLAEFQRRRARGESRSDAIGAAQQNVGPAILLATLALIVGFLGLVLSDFVPTIYFGALVSLSMLGGMMGNLIVLPLLLSFGR